MPRRVPARRRDDCPARWRRRRTLRHRFLIRHGSRSSPPYASPSRWRLICGGGERVVPGPPPFCWAALVLAHRVLVSRVRRRRCRPAGLLPSVSCGWARQSCSRVGRNRRQPGLRGGPGCSMLNMSVPQTSPCASGRQPCTHCEDRCPGAIWLPCPYVASNSGLPSTRALLKLYLRVPACHAVTPPRTPAARDRAWHPTAMCPLSRSRRRLCRLLSCVILPGACLSAV